MFSIIAAGMFSVVAILALLLAFGLPLGEFTMGGQHKVLPSRLRIMSGISFGIQLFAIVVVLQAGGHLPMRFSVGITKGICIVFAAYLSLNTIMNFFSKSKKERYAMTPLALIAAICFWITAFSI